MYLFGDIMLLSRDLLEGGLSCPMLAGTILGCKIFF